MGLAEWFVDPLAEFHHGAPELAPFGRARGVQGALVFSYVGESPTCGSWAVELSRVDDVGEGDGAVCIAGAGREGLADHVVIEPAAAARPGGHAARHDRPVEGREASRDPAAALNGERPTLSAVSNQWNNVAVTSACAAVVLGVMWVAHQGGVAPALPEAGAKFAANIYVILASVPALAVYWLGAAGYGYPIRRWLLRDLPYAPAAQVGAGMAALMLLNWLAAWAGGLRPAASWGIPSAGIVLLGVQLYLRSKDQPDPPAAPRRLPWQVVLLAPGIAMLLVAAACPPGTLWRVEAFGYDVLSYHLQIPRQWLDAGAMIPLRHNVYGFLPGLMEATYTHLGAMRGSIPDAIYTCQLFHASLAVFAAAATACAVAQLTSQTAGVVAAAVLLSVPWVLVTGSLAYNEMAMLAFGAAAILVLLDIRSERIGAAAVIGLLVGAATLAKPTAGPMLALPIGLVLLTRLNHAVRWRRPPALRKAVRAGAVAAAVGLATLSPWLIRNAVWAGNPVFPFATSVLGLGHWTAPIADRWDAGHGLSWHDADRAEALARQWLFNTGYGAAGGEPTPPELHNIARFDREYGWPVLWGAMLLAALLTVRQLALRRAVGAMLLILAVQLAFWLLATHLQSRFLVPSILPACVVIGLGVGRARQVMGQHGRWAMPVASAALVGSLVVTSFSVLQAQARHVEMDDRGTIAPLSVWVDALPLVDRTALDDLPMGSKVYLVADSTSLLYIDPDIDYHSAFDASPLGELIRKYGGDPAAVSAALRRRGDTHVWIHWGELDRLHETYGYDPDVTEASLHRLAQSWRVVKDLGAATLYRIGP